jgi:4-amino-4-deoxy-L-arabinose transferase-like glycosyltransferase
MQARIRALRISPFALVILLGAAVKFALHLLTGRRYGYFADELYTVALSRHPAPGYVDLPPLVPLLTAVSRPLFGESLTALHLLPALAGAATLVFVCLIAREFGGKWFAVALSALAFLIAPVWLILDSYLSYDAFDQLILAAFLYVLIRFLRSGNRRIWILLGAIAGLACLTKMTLLYLGPGFLAALLISKRRKDLLSPWPWLGAALCLVIVSPYLLWQAANGWPTLEYWRNYETLRLSNPSILDYAAEIFFTMNPVLSPLYGFGLVRLFRRRGDSNFRFFGVMFLATLVLLFLLHAKTWMLVELFLPLIAAGAVGVEELAGAGIRAKILMPSAAAALLAGGILAAPTCLPILPVESLPAYVESTGFLHALTNARFEPSEYPIYFALRIGWEDLVRDVADVYHGLSPEDRRVAGIYAFWYAPASAIDFFGPRYGLPPAVSGHLNYFLWGPRYSWDVMVVVTNPEYNFTALFSECELKKSVVNEYTIPLNQLNIYVCRKPKVPLTVLWERLKGYY